jgi:hypothetical protein
MADRLDARNVPDYTLRPNLLFALDLMVDERAAARATRTAWEALVYPWGVATLAQSEAFFHPYHVAWEHYHKDEAYHNGTVWPWLDGIAMQRMIEGGQTEMAWRLFRWTSDLALRRGVVGGLPETMDAYPHPGEAEPRLTGTFLQAWSNAEQLRVWYQFFLGVRPDLAKGAVLLAPRLPAALGAVDFTVRVGAAGTIRGIYGGAAGARRYAYRLAGLSTALTVDIPPFAVRRFAASAGDSLVVEVRGEELRVRLVSSAGAVKTSVVLAPLPARRARQAMLDAILAGAAFAAPRPVESHPVMRRVARRESGR